MKPQKLVGALAFAAILAYPGRLIGNPPAPGIPKPASESIATSALFKKEITVLGAASDSDFSHYPAIAGMIPDLRKKGLCFIAVEIEERMNAVFMRYKETHSTDEIKAYFAEKGMRGQFRSFMKLMDAAFANGIRVVAVDMNRETLHAEMKNAGRGSRALYVISREGLEARDAFMAGKISGLLGKGIALVGGLHATGIAKRLGASDAFAVYGTDRKSLCGCRQELCLFDSSCVPESHEMLNGLPVLQTKSLKE